MPARFQYPRKSPSLPVSYASFSSCSSPWQPLILLSVFIDLLILDISHTWSLSLCGLLSRPSSILHNVFKVHSKWSHPSMFHPSFDGQITLQCMDKTTFWLFPVFGCSERSCTSLCVDKYFHFTFTSTWGGVVLLGHVVKSRVRFIISCQSVLSMCIAPNCTPIRRVWVIVSLHSHQHRLWPVFLVSVVLMGESRCPVVLMRISLSSFCTAMISWLALCGTEDGEGTAAALEGQLLHWSLPTPPGNRKE